MYGSSSSYGPHYFVCMGVVRNIPVDDDAVQLCRDDVLTACSHPRSHRAGTRSVQGVYAQTECTGTLVLLRGRRDLFVPTGWEEKQHQDVARVEGPRQQGNNMQKHSKKQEQKLKLKLKLRSRSTARSRSRRGCRYRSCKAEAEGSFFLWWYGTVLKKTGWKSRTPCPRRLSGGCRCRWLVGTKRKMTPAIDRRKPPGKGERALREERSVAFLQVGGLLLRVLVAGR